MRHTGSDGTRGVVGFLLWCVVGAAGCLAVLTPFTLGLVLLPAVAVLLAGRLRWGSRSGRESTG